MDTSKKRVEEVHARVRCGDLGVEGSAVDVAAKKLAEGVGRELGVHVSERDDGAHELGVQERREVVVLLRLIKGMMMFKRSSMPHQQPVAVPNPFCFCRRETRKTLVGCHMRESRPPEPSTK